MKLSRASHAIRVFACLLAALLLWEASASAAVVAYYRFEDTVGSQIGSTLADSSGNNHNISVTGADASDVYAAIAADNPSTIPQTGAANTSQLQIGSAKSTLSMTAASSVAFDSFFANNGTAEFTIEGWFNPADYAYGQAVTLLGRGNQFSTGWSIYYNSTGMGNTATFGFFLGGTSYDAISGSGSSSILFQNEMTYFSIIGQANGDITFTLGSLTGTILGSSYSGATDTASDLYLGAGNKTGTFYLDEVRLSDTALTENELLVSVPEPSTAALMSLAAIFVLMRARGLRRAAV